MLKKAAMDAMRQNQIIQENIGLIWAVFWYNPQYVLIALPFHHGVSNGAAAAILSLESVYKEIYEYNKPIFIYILINTGILTIVGLYRIFRLYLKPIDRIVRQADEYQEQEDGFFDFRREDNELNRLSSALNHMLKKIGKDKRALQQAVASLEHANKELKKAQNEVIRAEKMASVGRLAAGIAHEIGNPVGIVLGYLELLRQNDLDDQEKTDCLQRAEKETQRINRIIRQLLDLNRANPCQQWQKISVNDIVEDVVEMLQPQPMMSDIQLKTQLNRDATDGVYADSDQLRQVFLNLLLNSADAIHTVAAGSGGRIIITTDAVSDVERSGRLWLQIRIHDNGPGVSAEHIHNIFDPFFTTKEPGKGTGLGLAVSYMIIERIGGKLTAESPPGGGTTLTVRLPLSVESSSKTVKYRQDRVDKE
jgi:signal transduction histidine kinase